MNKILEALKSREWLPVRTSERTFLVCKDCGHINQMDHAEDCKYLAAIREAERLPKRLTVEEIDEAFSDCKTNLGALYPEEYDFTAGFEAIHAAIYGEEPDHEC